MEIEPPFRHPALVVALDGWVNAGQAGTLAAETIAGDGPVVALFDHDQLYDFRMVRPIVQFEDGVITGLEWPRLAVSLAPFPERDILVLSGTEPNWHWEGLAASVVELCRRLEVEQYVGIGGVPWATPHTRPVSVLTTAGAAHLLPVDSGAPDGVLRVPAAAVSVIEWTVASSGLDAVGLWARVPNYVGGDFPGAAVALVERVCDLLGIVVDKTAMEEAAAERLVELDAIAAQRPEVQSVIAQLEQLHDSTERVSGDDLASEIERFLRDQS